MKKKKDRFIDEEKNSVEVKRLLLDNERQANLLIARVSLAFAILALTFLVLLAFKAFGYENTEKPHMIVIALVAVINFANSFNTFRLKGEGKNLRYVNLYSLALSVSLIYLILTYLVSILMVFPIVLSSRYFNKRFTIMVAIVTAILWLIGTYVGELYNIAWIDLNYYEMAEGSIIVVKEPSLYDSIISLGIDTVLRMKYIWNRVFIEMSFYTIVTIVSAGLAECGIKLMNRIARDRLGKVRITTELNVASKIQLDMLPDSSQFEIKDNAFDLSAVMLPAKEVSGDFYDFFYIDEEHLALVMADVSGKGIPAAIFMARAKTIIKSIAIGDKTKDTATIMRKVNEELCENNDESYFVTVWMGIINIKTGEGIATNAGHENPIVKRSGRKYEIVEYKHSMALGAFIGSKFESQKFQLNKDDVLVLYTDGVTETINEEKNQFGEWRMLLTLNNDINERARAEKIIYSLRDATKNFANGKEQSDDITLLCYRQKV